MFSLNRMQPQIPVTGYKTYGLLRPIATHFRRATCEEVECPAFVHGWITRVPRNSEQAQYVLSKAHGRTFTEVTALDSTEHEFLFNPGQMCFGAADHKLPIEREPIYIVRDGDWRGNPTGWRREHKNGDDWVEDFGEHQDVIAARVNRG